MTNADGKNAVVASQLESLASAAKDYTANLFAQVTIQGGDGESYDDFTGATANADGTSGLVPAPSAGDQNKFLRGDGTWVSISSGSSGGSSGDSSGSSGISFDMALNGKALLKFVNGNKVYAFECREYVQTSAFRNYLTVWLRFNQSATHDECGHTFTAVGNPTISADYTASGNALQLSTTDYIKCEDGVSLGGQDFTVDCFFRCTNPSPYYDEVFSFHNADADTSTRFTAAIVDANNFAFTAPGWQSAMTAENWRKVNNLAINDPNGNFLNKVLHCAFVYHHDEQKMYAYLDGHCFCVAATSLFQTAMTYSLLRIGKGYPSNGKFTGTIEEFRVHDGVALWTEDFIPPTVSDYV